MLEKLLLKKFELWVTLTIVIAGIIGSVLLAAAVRHAFTGGTKLGKLEPLIKSIAALPSTVRSTLFPPAGPLEASTQRFGNQSGFTFNYAAGSRPDYGYVLINRYDGDLGYAVSELFDLNSHEMVNSWNLSKIDDLWGALSLKSEKFDPSTNSSAKRSRNFHAMVMDTGEIYTHLYDTPIVAVDPCSNLRLVNDRRYFHHSLEKDEKGNFWVPSRIEPKPVGTGSADFDDDGIALASIDGKILFEKSVAQILDDNGLGYLIHGRGNVFIDPIHLNDIQPVLVDGRFWRKGDVFLSIRHQSMVLLYRPSSNKIIWHMQGPWLHQHDVNILNDHQISVFDNNATIENGTWLVQGVNRMVLFDFETDEASFPWQAGFEKLDIRTISEGRGEVVGDEIFVEESNYGRLIQFSSNGDLSWQFVNRAEKDGKISLLNWSRLVSRELGDVIRLNVSKRSCS